ncbi:DUF3800 domain-containing protein [Umezawaea endophytica]|uniref:DUF3800 domain-containing protein n=1 Tax=Umezawaea endophytica TaxID=1654476 RepID=A0A9X2VZA2_9PSEU|nr:DUF3800 domain-containing protein [Umezawaea endophytica]MCS7484508.1 DUF3800 domain-containing protein [Umezawaea endophytica]
MLLTYVDESYSKQSYFIAALLCPENEALSLTRALDSVVQQVTATFADLSLEAELHGYDLFQGKRDWTPLTRQVRARIDVYGDAFQAIADHDVRIIIRGVDTPKLCERYRGIAADPHSVVLTHLLERVDEYAERVGELALVIADEPGQQGHQLQYRADLLRYRKQGTWGYRGRVITRIVDTLHFAPSSASRLVQAVDLVVFMHNRIESTAPDTDKRAIAVNESLWRRIEKRIEHQYCWYP